MTHPEILQQLSCLLDKAIDEKGCGRALDHLKTCADCRLEYEGMRKLHALSEELKTFSPGGPSPFFETRLKARIRESQVPAAGGWKRLPALAVLTVTAIFLIVIGSTFGSFASAFSQKDPAVKKKVLAATVEKMSANPSVLNLVMIMNFCRSCRSAICENCGQCPPGGHEDGCCTESEDQGVKHE